MKDSKLCRGDVNACPSSKKASQLLFCEAFFNGLEAQIAWNEAGCSAFRVAAVVALRFVLQVTTQANHQ
jgi:hypothetical protein